jgi:hypothetical protein
VAYRSTYGAQVYHGGVCVISISVVECQWEIRHKRGGQTDRINVHLIIGVRVWTQINK